MVASSPFLVRCRAVEPAEALGLSRPIPVASVAFLVSVAFGRALLQRMGAQRMGVILPAGSETSGMRAARASIELRMSEPSSCRRCK